MLDLKIIQLVVQQLEEERGIERSKAINAIEEALAAAYKKEFGKRGQVIRAIVNMDTGETEFQQVKTVVDAITVVPDEEYDAPGFERSEDDERPRFNPEQHMIIEDAQRIKNGASVGDELVFPLEAKEDFGRIAAQTAKQMIVQKIREAEKEYLSEEFARREGEIVTGTVQRIERGNIFVDLGRATGILTYEEQIPGERYRQGERVRAYLYEVEESPRGIFLRLSRSHPEFLIKLFEFESPEVASGVVEIKAVAREAGARSKIAVYSHDDHIDPVGSCVGQRGVRVSTVMSELGGEKIDIIEWSEDASQFIEDALSPAKVLSVEIIDEEGEHAEVWVESEQQSLAIGKGGQNVRLAHKLTGWKIDIRSEGEEYGGTKNDNTPETSEDKEVSEKAETPTDTSDNKVENTKPEEKGDTDAADTPTDSTSDKDTSSEEIEEAPDNTDADEKPEND